MTQRRTTTVQCQICGQSLGLSEVLPASLVRPSIVETIRREKPEWSPEGYICLADLNHYRAEHVREMLESEGGQLSDLEADVVRSLQQRDLIAEDIGKTFEQRLGLGDRVADRVAEFGGSWGFILSFLALMALWILVNTIGLMRRPFDPYPYILLNLVLSCLAGLQAPIIMMSQNRQEEKDRLRAEYDYRVNLKAELEVRGLDAKLDLLMRHQWQRLLEIQEIQTEMVAELARHTELEAARSRSADEAPTG